MRRTASRNPIRGREAAACVAIGAIGGLAFLFVFPKGAITTLMHEVLHLPGPGAGIALVLGPCLILVALIASILSHRHGGALLATVTFAASYALVAWLLAVPTSVKGAFGSAWFIAAVAVFGVVLEVVLVLGKRLKSVWRCMLAGASANAALLVFYWLAVFPHTTRWVAWKDVPVLLGLSLACGLVLGFIVWLVARRLSRAPVPELKE